MIHGFFLEPVDNHENSLGVIINLTYNTQLSVGK